jgi:hypothetical protein
MWKARVASGSATVGELHHVRGHDLIGTVTTLALGGSGWTQTEVRRFTISTSDYDKLAAMIDAVLAEPVRPFKGEEVIACADDPGFLTERLSDGTARWLSGSMTVPNYAIAKALITATGVPAFDPAPLPLGGCVKRG